MTQMKKKIFFLINSLETGGAERVVSELSSHLAKDYAVEIITLKNAKNDAFYNSSIKCTSLLNTNSNLAMALALPYCVLKLKSLIKREKPFKIISFLELSNFINILANKNAVISFRTDLSFFRGIKGAIYKFLIRSLYSQASRIVVNSEENKARLSRRLNVASGKISVIYNPINLKQINRLKYEPLEKELTSQIAKKRIFVSVGRLDALKNFEMLIKSFKSLVDKDDKNVLLIVGEGALRRRLEALVERLNLKRSVLLVGKKKNVFKYLNKADYFIYASEAEGFPNVLLEATACGLPIITTDFRSGARELIEPKLGFEQKISYPYFGRNGALLSINKFGENLNALYPNLSKVRHDKSMLKSFDASKVALKWKKLITFKA